MGQAMGDWCIPSCGSALLIHVVIIHINHFGLALACTALIKAVTGASRPSLNIDDANGEKSAKTMQHRPYTGILLARQCDITTAVTMVT